MSDHQASTLQIGDGGRVLVVRLGEEQFGCRWLGVLAAGLEHQLL